MVRLHSSLKLGLSVHSPPHKIKQSHKKRIRAKKKKQRFESIIKK